MRGLGRLSLLGAVLIVAGCSTQPDVIYPSRSSGGYGHQQQDPLRKTAGDANSVESIVSSAARIGRLLGGGSY